MDGKKKLRDEVVKRSQLSKKKRAVRLTLGQDGHTMVTGDKLDTDANNQGCDM